jgi:hypothetical protein
MRPPVDYVLERKALWISFIVIFNKLVQPSQACKNMKGVLKNINYDGNQGPLPVWPFNQVFAFLVYF